MISLRNRALRIHEGGPCSVYTVYMLSEWWCHSLDHHGLNFCAPPTPFQRRSVSSCVNFQSSSANVSEKTLDSARVDVSGLDIVFLALDRYFPVYVWNRLEVTGEQVPDPARSPSIVGKPTSKTQTDTRMCVCICVCMYARTHVWMDGCTHVCMHVFRTGFAPSSAALHAHKAVRISTLNRWCPNSRCFTRFG